MIDIASGSKYESKGLGLPSAISICVGLIVASSCLLSLGQGIGLAGNGFIVSMFIVLILNGFLALSFNELHDLMPRVDGGLGQYTKAALGNMMSIVSNISAYVVVNLLAVSVEVSMCGIVVNSIFLPQIPAPVISILFLAVLTYVNYKGVDLFAKTQNIVVSLLLVSLTAMGIISYFKLGTGEIISSTLQSAPSVTGFGGCISLSAMAFWLFIGIEFVIPVANELKNPKRDVLLAMILGICMLFIIQSILGKGMMNYVTLEVLSTSEMPHMVFAGNLLGKVGEVWMGFVTILAAISSANTVLGSIPRVLSGMAENDLLPSAFAKKNNHGVALWGLIMMVSIVAILVVSGFAESSGLYTLILAASCFWITSYILTNLAVLVLRRKFKNHPLRNNKLTFKGIPQIIAIVGDIYMILNIAVGEQRIFIYTLYLVILAGMLLFSYIWLKHIKKLPLFKGMSLEEMNEME